MTTISKYRKLLLLIASLLPFVGGFAVLTHTGPGWAATRYLNCGEFLPWRSLYKAKVVLPLGDACRFLCLWSSAGVLAVAVWNSLRGRVSTKVGSALSSRVAGFVVAGASLFLMAGIAYFIFGGRPVELDEYVYTLQAKIFANGRLSVRMLDARNIDWVVFFKGPTEVVTRGRWFTMYPPLHPFLLALGEKIEKAWLVGPILSAAAVALAYAACRRLYGGGIAIGAAVLVATSPLFLFNGAARYSESTFFFFYALFIFYIIKASQSADIKPFYAAGAAAGFAFGAREFAAVQAISVPILYGLLITHEVPRLKRCLALGATAIVAALPEFIYNAVVTGSAFRFPRFMTEVHHFSLAAVPFGLRVSRWAWQIQLLANELWGWPLISFFPAVFALLLIRRRGWDWVWWITLFIVPVTNLAFGYHGIFYGPRYLCPIIIPAAFLTARVFGDLRVNAVRSVWGLFAAWVFCNCIFYLPKATKVYKPAADEGVGWLKPEVTAVVREAKLRHAVVFLAPRWAFRWPMPNDVNWRDEVIYARDFGYANRRLMDLFPTRSYYRLDYEAACQGRGALTRILPRAPRAGEDEGERAYRDEVNKLRAYANE